MDFVCACQEKDWTDDKVPPEILEYFEQRSLAARWIENTYWRESILKMEKTCWDSKALSFPVFPRIVVYQHCNGNQCGSVQRCIFQALSAQEKKNLDIQNEVCLQVPVTNGITASNLGKSERRDIGQAGYLNLGWWGVSLLPSIGKHRTKIQALGSEKEGEGDGMT